MTLRNGRLDSLRGIASLSVLFHHSIHSMDLNLAERVLNVPVSSVAANDVLGRAVLSLFAGGVAVNIFFVLSGAVLTASLQREASPDFRTIVNFVGKRVLRVYPALVVMVMVFGLLSYVYPAIRRDGPFSLRQIIETSLLLAHSVNGATWTLQAEMLMIPFVLLVAFGRLILGNIAPIVFLFWAPSCLFLGAPFAHDLLSAAIPSFALGMIIPTLSPAIVSRLPAWTVFLTCTALVGTRLFFPLTDSHASIFLLALSFVLVALLYHSEQQNPSFDHPVLTSLGRVSYSLYLLHPVVIAGLLPLFIASMKADRIGHHYVIFGLVFATLVMAITVPLAALCERYVERPFIQVGQIIFSRR